LGTRRAWARHATQAVSDAERISMRSSRTRFWKRSRRRRASTQEGSIEGSSRKTRMVWRTARRTDEIVWRKKGKRRGMS